MPPRVEAQEATIEQNVLYELEKLWDPEWRLSDEAVFAMVKALEEFKPKIIVEFGTGYSSVFLYEHACAVKGDYAGVDEVGEWSSRQLKAMNVCGYDKYYQHLKICPLVVDDGFYDLEGVELPKADFVLIDGPQAVNGRMSTKAVEAYEKVGDENTIWMIDDVNIPQIATLAKSIYYGARNNRRSGYRAAEIPDQKFPWRMTSLLIPEAKWQEVFNAREN
jgi:hypothetical protein